MLRKKKVKKLRTKDNHRAYIYECHLPHLMGPDVFMVFIYTKSIFKRVLYSGRFIYESDATCFAENWIRQP